MADAYILGRNGSVTEMAEVIHFINLTNGIQAIEDYELSDYRFLRLQSTACEQKRWEDIIMTITDDFMVATALGHNCIVYDYGANKEVPRAIWQGLEWVKYCLLKRWHNTEYQPQGRMKTGAEYFSSQYKSLSKKVKNRLDYYGRYVNGPLCINAISSATNRDGSIQWYANILKKRGGH